MTVAADTKLRTWPRITADGSDLPESWLAELVELRVRTGLRAVGRATLTFTDPVYALSEATDLTVGTAVKLTSLPDGAASPSVTLLEGTVTAIETELVAHGGALLTVTVDDAAVDLARAEGAETYHEMTYPNVVSQLTSEVRMTAQVDGLPATVMPFTMRNDTRLGLIDEIAQRYGCDWIVEGTVLHLWPAATGNLTGAGQARLTVGSDLFGFAVRQVSDAPTDVTVRGWDVAQQQAIVATASSPAARAGRAPATTSGKKFELTEARLGVRSDADARDLAKGLAARTGRMVARGRAAFTPALRAGGMLLVENAGPAKGTYYVREVTHVVDQSGSRTSFVAGDRDPVRLGDAGTPAPGVSSFRRGGLAVALVDNLKDPEKLGRVSVSIITASEQAKSAWARVLQPGAGSERGHLFLPDVGDEVLVGFENDDLARPVVLGGLYGGRAKPHQAVVDDSGRLVAHVIRTRSGHVIELAEGQQESEQHVLLKLANGAQLRVGQDAVLLEAPSGKPLTLKAGSSSITFDGNGKITVKGTTIELAATGAVGVDAKDKVTVKGTLGVALEGLEASLKGQAKTSVEASGVVEVKGAMVKIN
ncbi:hypothetical protein KIN34_01715 [Cellulomonas sp. DKR-3]|uniref:Gp5/Type VI secretion system Vgr protein OB-fold domain-containing protein n=1 Tax=Cellulomonas fulva TaxID=2835530 RepID=A0ABS5TV41_9CELL|nr:phage baseplate assembly protein V [Cellulomonas fulva]MBT0993008.1 hypothetical protein [Cellulomonas fulva]